MLTFGAASAAFYQQSELFGRLARHANSTATSAGTLSAAVHLTWNSPETTHRASWTDALTIEHRASVGPKEGIVKESNQGNVHQPMLQMYALIACHAAQAIMLLHLEAWHVFSHVAGNHIYSPWADNSDQALHAYDFSICHPSAAHEISSDLKHTSRQAALGWPERHTCLPADCLMRLVSLFKSCFATC